MPDPEDSKAGLIGRLRQWRQARKRRAGEREAARRGQKLPRSSSEHGGNKPGAGGGYSGGY